MTKFFTMFVAIMGLGLQALIAQEAEQCSDHAEYSELDFWLGEWEVYTEDEKQGHNRIEKILGDCIVMEHWVGIGGSMGKSVFYYDLAQKTWKQLWFTQWARHPGGIKEKTLVKRFPNGGVRFQGVITKADGDTYLDRTTLTPMENGNVLQLIEISVDNGKSWKATFDAVYKRRTIPPPNRG